MEKFIGKDNALKLNGFYFINGLGYYYFSVGYWYCKKSYSSDLMSLNDNLPV